MKVSKLVVATLLSVGFAGSVSNAAILSCRAKLYLIQKGALFGLASGTVHAIFGGQAFGSKMVQKGLDKVGDHSAKASGMTSTMSDYLEAHPRAAAIAQAAGSEVIREHVKEARLILLGGIYEAEYPGSFPSALMWKTHRGARIMETELEPAVQKQLMDDNAQITLRKEDLAKAVKSFNDKSKACVIAALDRKKLVKYLAREVETSNGKTAAPIESEDEDGVGEITGIDTSALNQLNKADEKDSSGKD